LPKIDEYEDLLFIVCHFPVLHKQARVTTPSQVSIFIGEDYVITIHAGDLKPLARLFRDCHAHERARQENLGPGSGYLLYRILDRLVDYCFPILNKVISNIESVEDAVFSRPVPDTVKEIMLIRRDLVAFRRIIRAQVGVLDTLEEIERPFLKKDLEVYFGDIADHVDKIWNTLEDYKEVIDNLSDTSNWLTSHHIQEVMRVIAIASAILLPAAVLSSIYGMNVPLPLAHSPYSFAVLSGVMLVVSGVVLAFFRWRRWI